MAGKLFPFNNITSIPNEADSDADSDAASDSDSPLACGRECSHRDVTCVFGDDSLAVTQHTKDHFEKK